MAYLKEVSHLRFIPSDFGSDVLLLVDRGIPCEAHTEVFSAHTTNQPDEAALQMALEMHKEGIQKSWEGFISLTKNTPKKLKIGRCRSKNWDYINRIGEAYCKELVTVIAKDAEEIAIQEHEKSIEGV